jgi:outer membrane protein TolC
MDVANLANAGEQIAELRAQVAALIQLVTLQSQQIATLTGQGPAKKIEEPTVDRSLPVFPCEGALEAMG